SGRGANGPSLGDLANGDEHGAPTVHRIVTGIRNLSRLRAAVCQESLPGTVSGESYLERAGVSGCDGARRNLANSPDDVDQVPSTRAQAGDGSLLPGDRQCGKDPQDAAVTLQEHLGDRGGAAEVAVDLEDAGRME